MHFPILSSAAMLAALMLVRAPLPPQFLPEPLDASEPVSFYIDVGDGIEGLQPGDSDLARLAFEAWSRESGGRLRFLEVDSADEALVNLVWVTANSGLFGQTQKVVRDGKPGAIVFVTAQVNALGPDLAVRVARDPLLRHAIVYLTCVHELGHAVGLPHTRAFEDIMYSFGFGGDIVEYFMRYRRNLTDVNDIGSHSGLSSGDREALGRLYPVLPGTVLNLGGGIR